jgi:hypothetical protein
MAAAPQEFTDYLVYSGQFAVDIWDMGLDNLDPDPATPKGVSLRRIPRGRVCDKTHSNRKSTTGPLTRQGSRIFV